jgi:hypothetical protein
MGLRLVTFSPRGTLLSSAGGGVHEATLRVRSRIAALDQMTDLARRWNPAFTKTMIKVNDTELMELFRIDEAGLLFVSPEIVDWRPLAERRIRLVIDLDGQVDVSVPTVPNNLIYIYFPFDDAHLPDLIKLHALGRLAAEMVRQQRAVLIHCAMGFNRSPLMAGLALTYAGMSGAAALDLLRERRPGALYNAAYADYLAALPPFPDFPAT